MSEHDVAGFGAHPNAENAVMVRHWDDHAKDPDGPVLEVAELLADYDRLSPRTKRCTAVFPI
jgi:gamma-butyrobetaine dioxygenase